MPRRLHAIALVTFCAPLSVILSSSLWVACFDFDATSRGGGPDGGGADGGDAKTDVITDARVDAGCFVPPPDGGCRLFHEDCRLPAGCYVDPDEDAETLLHCSLLGTGTNGAPCDQPSSCAEGFACIGSPDASLCTPWCLVLGTTPPFDLCGIDITQVGRGGCPPNARCEPLNGVPAWLGTCVE